MSIMSMFSNIMGAATPVQQQQAATSAMQQQTPGAGNPGNIPQGSDNQNSTNPTVPADQQGPLDQFKDLWQPVQTDPSKQTTGILGNVDPAKVMEVAGKTDFSKVISQDTLAKINAGGPEAMGAMMEAMNKMAQVAYANSAIAASKMVEQAAGKMEERFKADLPGEFKRLNLSSSLRDENPIFQNPAISPLISAMETQFAQKFPQASQSELNKMAKDYMLQVGSAFNPTQSQQATQTQNQKGNEDWTKFFVS